MKRLLNSVFLILALLSGKGQLNLDTSKYVIFDDKNSILKGFAKNLRPAPLTESEILDIEDLMEECIDKFNRGQVKYYSKLNKKERLRYDIEQHTVKLDKFKRQIVPVINAKGEKEVWVNCFRPFTNYAFPYWRQKFVFVYDGGNYFFNLKINLAKKKFYNLSVNGVA